MYIKNGYLFKKQFAKLTFNSNFVWWIDSLRNWLTINFMEGYWRVHLVDISTYINLYVPIWSLTHLYLIFISDLKPLLLGDVDKKEKKRKSYLHDWSRTTNLSEILCFYNIIHCVLARETRDLCQAEKKVTAVPSWANAQNGNYFIQNGRSCHDFDLVSWQKAISWSASEVYSWLSLTHITLVFCWIVAWIQPDISGCQKYILAFWRWNQLRTF